MRRVLIVLLLTCAGCAAKEAETSVVSMTEVAPELVTVAQKALPTVKFTSARKTLVNGEVVYEIRGIMPNGKVREVEVSLTGQVLDVE